jgi:tetratricopeptide (TPR) repeat protein
MGVLVHELAVVAQMRGRFEEAEDFYRKSLTISEELGDRAGMAMTYGQLGTLAHQRERLEEAEDWFRRSLEITEALGARPVTAKIYHQLGIVAQDRGRLDEAQDRYHKSLTIKEKLGDKLGIAITYHHLGLVAQEGDRLDEAADWYRKSLTIMEGLGDRAAIGKSYHQLGILAHKQKRFDEAEDWYRKSLAIFEEFGNRLEIAKTLHQLGMVAQNRRQWDEAEALYRKSLTISEELGDRPGTAASYGHLGLLAEDKDRFDEALEWMVRCNALFLPEFPSRSAGPGPQHLRRLTTIHGLAALERLGGPSPKPSYPRLSVLGWKPRMNSRPWQGAVGGFGLLGEKSVMTDSIEAISRAAASRLAAQGEPAVVAEVEAALVAGPDGHRDQYVDPISLGALIVSVATLAWQVYTDLKARKDTPSKEVLARRVRIQLENSDHTSTPDDQQVIEIVVDETIEQGEQSD